MFGHNRNSGIHTLSNYNEAHHAWESTKPIRGRKEDTRPLGHRRCVDQYTIRKAESGAIECVLYKTPVVSYLTDGQIVIKDDGWKSVSTAYFIEEVLGIGSRIFNKDLNVSFSHGEYPVPTDGLHLAYGVSGHLYPINPQALKVHAIDRKGANNVRARYKDFNTYMMGMLKLRANDVVTTEEVKMSGMGVYDLDRTYHNKFPEQVQAFFGLVNDRNPETQTASWYHATLALVRAFGRWSYKADGVVVPTDASKIARKFDELVLGFNRDECLSSRELSLGEVKRDNYAKYFSSGWKLLHKA